jgi:hypothetical protein
MASTQEARQARLILMAGAVQPAELVPVDILDAVCNLQPALDRLRRGEWEIQVTGASSPSDRDCARLFPVHLLDLADALDARR